MNENLDGQSTVNSYIGHLSLNPDGLLEFNVFKHVYRRNMQHN